MAHEVRAHHGLPVVQVVAVVGDGPALGPVHAAVAGVGEAASPPPRGRSPRGPGTLVVVLPVRVVGVLVQVAVIAASEK